MSFTHPSTAVYWIWLQQRLGVASRVMMTIAEMEGGARLIYESTPDQLWSTGLFSVRTINALNDRDLAPARQVLSRCEELDISVTTPDAADYPGQLRSLPDLPAVLFYKGKLREMCSRPCIALVGTRGATDYGKRAAGELARRLSRAGMTVVSGCARGIDTAAHSGALEAHEGGTAAVLGCGIDCRYNMANEKLRAAIAEKGVIISEYPPGTDASAFHFPLRNRIISGLSLGTIVIEADTGSGSLITARMAAEQGRDVFAMPAAAGMPKSSGIHQLLCEGAMPLRSPMDVLGHYAHMYPMSLRLDGAERPLMFGEEPEMLPANVQGERVQKKPAEQPVIPSEPKLPEGISAQAGKLHSFLRPQPILLDSLAEQAGVSTVEAMNLLTELELCGCARAHPGNRYSLA